MNEEYKKYHSSDKAKKRRAARNKIRRKLEREGKVRKGDGKEIDHKNYDPTDNSRKNIRVVSRSENRKRQPKRKGRPKAH